MSYSDIADMAQDGPLLRRILACAWQEITTEDPGAWAVSNVWRVVSQPGWADAWSSARASGIVNLGADESVITDQMILSAVQTLRV